MLKSILFISALFLLNHNVALSNSCKQTLTAADNISFDKSELIFPNTCKTITVELKHIGRLPKEAMGHNLVISEKKHVKRIVRKIFESKIEDHFVPDSKHVIASSKLIGGGENTRVVIETKEFQDKQLEYFSSFPGHASIMKGTISFR